MVFVRHAMVSAITGRSVRGALGLKESCIGWSPLEGMTKPLALALGAEAGREAALAATGASSALACLGAALAAAFLALASSFFAAFFLPPAELGSASCDFGSDLGSASCDLITKV